MKRTIELLAPARNVEIAREAILHGADAVYIGAPSHGARAAAANPVAAIAELCDFAHRFRCRVYVTLNTLVYDNEVPEVEQLVRELYRAGVDALIVQDMSLLRMDIPPVQLHASTQCDTRTPQKARMLADAGFSQVVIARETSVEETRSIVQAIDPVPVEVFVHGALCVSYSGDCRASLMTTGRSANRGECAQICRYAFDLIDGAGNTVEQGRHLLSLRDMNRSAILAELVRAGVSSLKIEGRLKEMPYVKNVTAAYHLKLNDLLRSMPDAPERCSAGDVALTFSPELDRSFNRGFTTYFADGDSGPALNGLRMASVVTPKSRGRRVGTVVALKGRSVVVKCSEPVANGDGLNYIDRDGRMVGFRVNRAEGNRIFPATDVRPAPGTVLYRNSDKVFTDLLSRPSATRTIRVDMTLRALPDGSRIALDLADARGMRVTVVSEQTPEASRSPQSEPHRRTLAKTLDTIYRVGAIDDRMSDLFVPISVLSDLRRRGIEALDRAARITYRFGYRADEKTGFSTPEHLDSRANVANRLAASFYADHGTRTIDPALETIPRTGSAPVQVMECRYCLRRELGACLRTPRGRKLKEPLTLRSAGASFRLGFDCDRCRMTVNTLPTA